MNGLRVVYGLFCARHKLALFTRSTDKSIRDFRFLNDHRRCSVAVGRWLV